jgi:hypothetical protein
MSYYLRGTLTLYVVERSAVYVLPLPFGLVLALLPRREARLLRHEERPMPVMRGPNHRERVLAAADIAIYRRPIA